MPTMRWGTTKDYERLRDARLQKRRDNAALPKSWMALVRCKRCGWETEALIYDAGEECQMYCRPRSQGGCGTSFAERFVVLERMQEFASV